MTRRSPTITEPFPIRLLISTVCIGFLLLMIGTPVVVVFAEAFSKGIATYWQGISEPYALSAIRLTLIVTAIVVPANILFGLAASWVITRFEFIGKHVLLTLIDLPFSVSPVISGLIYVMLFGVNSMVGRWLNDHGMPVIFALPGIVLATLFITLPLVARELIPLMQEQGTEEEEAALLLGASGWQTFIRITLPKIKWGLLYGILLCAARAMGEFGAVSVVSGHIKGRTNTIPLHVEELYNDYNFVAAFAVASILTLMAVVTLAIKRVVATRVQTG